MTQYFQPISVFKKDPYKKILTFPQVTESEITKRMVELRKLGITHISFTGPLQIEKCHILGKGYVGMVVLAKKRSEPAPPRCHLGNTSWIAASTTSSRCIRVYSARP